MVSTSAAAKRRSSTSRYLYRGVISEANILSYRNGEATFRYTESKTGDVRTRTLPGAQFLLQVIQHALPRGFHRARDYGFLHENARQTRQLVQLILQVTCTPPRPERERPGFCCSACGKPLVILHVYAPHLPRCASPVDGLPLIMARVR